MGRRTDTYAFFVYNEKRIQQKIRSWGGYRRMRQFMKKHLLLLFVATVFPMFASADDSGSCGENLTWTYTEATNTLTISGTGDMYEGRPWEPYRMEIQTVIIEEGVTSIGKRTFYGCSGLTSLTIPNSVTFIGEEAFAESSLTAINLPSSVETIGHEAFRHCPSLATIIVDKDNKTFDSRDNCNAIIRTADNELVLGCKTTVIPNTVISLGEAAFMGCDEMATIKIPNSVTTIRRTVFYDCKGLVSLTFPNSVTVIEGESVFRCPKLETIKIGSGLKTFDGRYNFNRCENLKDFYIFAVESPTIETGGRSLGMFNDTPISSATLHVPAELNWYYSNPYLRINSQQYTNPWSLFGNIVALTEEDIEEMNQASGIQTVMNAPNGQVESVYTIGGQRINKSQRGLNIIRTKDGKTKKVVVK